MCAMARNHVFMFKYVVHTPVNNGVAVVKYMRTMVQKACVSG